MAGNLTVSGIHSPGTLDLDDVKVNTKLDLTGAEVVGLPEVGLSEGGFIRGTIAMWCLAGKSETDKRTWLDECNWYICDGGGHAQEKGRADYADVPNLQDRFTKGASTHAKVGVDGGSSTTDGETLVSATVPEHRHTGTTSEHGGHTHDAEISAFGGGMALGDGIKFSSGQTGQQGAHDHSFTTGSKGGSGAHSHTGVNPPNTLVDYIIYLGPRI